MAAINSITTTTTTTTHFLIIFLLSTSLLFNHSYGHQSPASPHSCSHAPHHHGHHDHHHHSEDEPTKKRKLLPEELAEEEDLLLYGFGSDHHEHDHAHDGSHSHLSGVGLWMNAMGCSLLVSLASLVCLIILPILCANGKPSKVVVDFLALFGAGAMLGDAFLHQLPRAFSGGHSHAHDHDVHSESSHSHSLEDLSTGLSILFGIVTFLIVEKIVRFVEEFSRGAHAHHHHHHHHKHSKKLKVDDSPEKLHLPSADEKALEASADATANSKQVSGDQTNMRKRNKKVNSADGRAIIDAANGKVGEAKPTQPSNRVFGYLNLFSDAVHNFTDGMALGSAFLLYGSVGGWSRRLELFSCLPMRSLKRLATLGSWYDQVSACQRPYFSTSCLHL